MLLGTYSRIELSYQLFFFFQAEDGIRDYKVTGVQTCALPICAASINERPPSGTSTMRYAPGSSTSSSRSPLTTASHSDEPKRCNHATGRRKDRKSVV